MKKRMTREKNIYKGNVVKGQILKSRKKRLCGWRLAFQWCREKGIVERKSNWVCFKANRISLLQFPPPPPFFAIFLYIPFSGRLLNSRQIRSNPSPATNHIPTFPCSFLFISSTNSSSSLVYFSISSLMMEDIDMIREEHVVMVARKDESQIMKGRRTKRDRAPSPLRLAIAMPFAAATCDELCSSSSELRDTTPPTEEEADMANCLILLAKGKISHPVNDGACLYQCKTCERGFPSFRALGGHRARHKKMKPNPYEDYSTSTALSLQFSNSSSRLSLCSANNKSSSKVHECSICGAEFSSGQALGGHMRRHRTLVNASSAVTIGSPESHQDVKKPRNVFKLDLNLPATDDEDHDHHSDSKFSFHFKDSVLVLSASPLVDCHY